MALPGGFWVPSAWQSLLDHQAPAESEIMLLQAESHEVKTRASPRRFELVIWLVRREGSTARCFRPEREGICAPGEHRWRIFHLVPSRTQWQRPADIQTAQVWLQLFENRWLRIRYRLDTMYICIDWDYIEGLKRKPESLSTTRPWQWLFLWHILWLLAEEAELWVDHRPPESWRGTRPIDQNEDKQHWYWFAALLKELFGFRFDRFPGYYFKEKFEFHSRLWMHQDSRTNCLFFPDSEIRGQWGYGERWTPYLPKRHQAFEIFLQVQEDLWSKLVLSEWHDNSINDFVHHGACLPRRQPREAIAKVEPERALGVQVPACQSIDRTYFWEVLWRFLGLIREIAQKWAGAPWAADAEPH